MIVRAIFYIIDALVYNISVNCWPEVMILLNGEQVIKVKAINKVIVSLQVRY